jgi:hypothetical protein
MTMSMDQGAQCLVIHCDSCPMHIETDHVEYVSALDAAKMKGWRAYIGPDKKWAHSCPACVEAYAAERRS